MSVRSKGAHRGVLLARIPTRHDDRHLQTESSPRESEALAVIAARRRNDPLDRGLAPNERLAISQPAAHLESARRLMVLVLDHDLGPEPLREQRPREGRRRAEALLHKAVGFAKFAEGEHWGDSLNSANQKRAPLLLWGEGGAERRMRGLRHIPEGADPLTPDPSPHSPSEDGRPSGRPMGRGASITPASCPFRR